MTNGFLASELRKEERQKPLFHVVPVPMEMTVSYGGGTAKGPDAILVASQQLERWDGYSEPFCEGITTLPAVDCSGSVEQILQRIEVVTVSVLETGGIPVLLGGEHTVSLGAIRALAKKQGQEPFGLVQIDAHADLRDSYEESPFRHACVVRRAMEECGCQLFQFGIRALCLEEVEYRHRQCISYLDGAEIPNTPLSRFRLPEDFPENIYLTIDVDGLDPAIIPATGTPVPGGPTWYQTLTFINSVLAGRNLVGFDCVELAPQAGDHRSDFAAAQLTYSVMGMVSRSRAGKS